MYQKFVADNQSVLKNLGIQLVPAKELIEQYEYFFFDVYGVFESGSGIIDSAIKVIQYAHELKKNVFIVTNNGNALPATIAEKYNKKGLGVAAENIITSAMPLKKYFEDNDLVGKKVLNVGNEGDSAEYIRRAGGIPLANDDVMSVYKEAEVIVLSYQKIDHTLKDAALNAILRNPGIPVIQTNTDIFAPHSRDELKFAAASIGFLLKEALNLKGVELQLVSLGKPDLYHKAFEIIQSRDAGINKQNTLIIGDDLGKDIKGGQMVGIPTLLLHSGAHVYLEHFTLAGLMKAQKVFPTYYLPVLA